MTLHAPNPSPPARAPAANDRAARESEGRFFDQLVDDRGEFNPFADRGWKTLARQFTAMVPIERPVRLLDIGCGTGQSRQLYARHARLYAGVDLSRRGLDIARRQFPESAWVRADANQLPFEDGSWDVIAFSSVLHHIPDFGRALREALRVVRPGGHVFAFDPNLLHPAMALFRCPASPLYTPVGVSPNERPLTAWALRAAFVAAGFERVRQHGQSDIPYRAVAPRGMNACLKAYNAADRLLQASGLARWFGTFIVTAATRPHAAGGTGGRA